MYYVYQRNGHAVVPVTVSAGTLLYHGRNGRVDPAPPTGAEWLTLDVDHATAYSAFRGRIFSYAAERDFRLLYFDGVSAAPLATGTQDVQDVIIYGNVSDFHRSPFVRIVQLCDWGKQYELDGFFRMGYDFEIMLCNFTNGLTRLSDIDVVPGMLEHPLGWQGSIRDPMIMAYEFLATGNWHNVEPIAGLKIDYSRMISFFDRKYESLVELRRHATSRLQYRMFNISKTDVQLFRAELDDALLRPCSDMGSGVQWEAIMRHIIASYGDRLHYLQQLLHSLDRRTNNVEDEGHDVPKLVVDVRQQVLTMLAPYISRASIIGSDSDGLNHTWFEETVGRCSTKHTAHLAIVAFAPQEHNLKSAIDETVREICRTLGIIWRTAYTAESITSHIDHVALVEDWAREIDRLIEWLNWAEWQKCDPPCSADHYCSLPQWPFDGIGNGDEDLPVRCISKLHYKPISQDLLTDILFHRYL